MEQTCGQPSKEGKYKPKLPEEEPPQLSNNSKGQVLQITGTAYHGICLLLWDPHTQRNINKLEMVQRRGTRFVKGDYRRTSSVTAMLSDLQ